MECVTTQKNERSVDNQYCANSVSTMEITPNHFEILETRIKKWREKLIDLSKRNRLLNFRFYSKSTLRIVDNQPSKVFTSLIKNRDVMGFLSTETQQTDLYVANDKLLKTEVSSQDLNTILTKISTNARSANADLGYNILFMTLGSIIWYEGNDNTDKMEAPIFLIPIEIKRASISKPYTVKYNEDDIILNPALKLKLNKDFGIDLYNISFNDETNLNEVFKKIQKKIAVRCGWELRNSIYIGLFSFAKFVMYQDLYEYQDLIKESGIIKIICGLNKEKQLSVGQVCPLSEIDIKVKPEDTYQILDADSSQQQAIQMVKSGNNLVLEGPPGTGKSQTIANMIAELLSQNKKVLFVSQKIAALDVVKKRLTDKGLAPFCLELHSNKTNKKNVVKDLLDTLDYDYNLNFNNRNELSSLSEKIKNMREYSQQLHMPTGKLQYSPFKALGIVVNNSHIPDFEYIFYNYQLWTSTLLSENKKLFFDTAEVIKKLGKPESFSWYGAEIRKIDYETYINLKNNIKSFVENTKKLIIKINQLTDEIAMKRITKPEQINGLISISNLILNIPLSSMPSVYNERLVEDIQTVCDTVSKFNFYNTLLKNNYDFNILNADIQQLIKNFEIYEKKFLSKISFRYYKDCKFVKHYYKKNYKPKINTLIQDLKNLKQLSKVLSDIEGCNDTACRLYGPVWERQQPDEELIKKTSKCLLKLRALVESKKIFTDNISDKLTHKKIQYDIVKNLIIQIRELQEKTKKDFDIIADILKFDCKKAFLADYGNVQFIDLINKFTAISKTEDLTLWFKFLQLKDSINKASLSDFWNICVGKKIPLEDYAAALETQFLRIWLKGYVFKNNDILNTFNYINQDQLVKEFRQLDKKQILSAEYRLLKILADNVAISKEIYNDETSGLRRQSKLTRTRKTLREILLSIPNLLLSLKPCLMMSPMTVAQLIDPQKIHFDVIIFDEASQLPTEDCIGSIIRGDKLVVAGDTKQLPPTSFFQTIFNEYLGQENDNQEDISLDSILDECAISGLPQCVLKWHYRSKHEHLIAFSNKHLYKELYTFPSCTQDSETLGVKFLYHNPKGLTKEAKTLEEAQLVAKAVMQHAKKYPNMSLGVATLNIKQKELIENELEKLRVADTSCEDFFDTNKPEVFFVKNLESVQGDERDVIIISIGYFKNANGILPMNFGPINKEGGERRLNVLITRARYMVKIFSGIKASDFDLNRTGSYGVKLLQSYLDFAERGEIALQQIAEAEFEDRFDSPFEESVCKSLREKGYCVKTQVGCSGYKIDLAIIDKNNPGKFLLGIECDGASYHSCATVRDRDRLRQEVLENLGWKIYRIWSTDWFKNPKRQMDKIVDYINKISN